jgi:serine/threonine protein kinase
MTSLQRRTSPSKVTILARDAADRESTMNNEIRRRVRDTSNLLLSCETFSLPSPNGHHRVLVPPVNYKPQSPRAWCAPERLHNTDPSAASVMWSYMCVFTKLYLGTLPWSIYGDALPGIVKVLGPLPQTWCGRYHQPTRTDASWYDPRKQPEFTPEAMIAHARPDVSSTERAHVLSFMLKGFSYNPQHRITAAQLLDNASFQAVMRVYCA